MNLWEFVVLLAAAFVAALVLPLVIPLDAQTVEIFLQHARVLEFVVGPSVVIRAGLLQYLVEDGSLR